MKVSELREMTVQELQQKVDEIHEKLFNLRFQRAMSQMENPMFIRKAKRNIARIKTLIGEKQKSV